MTVDQTALVTDPFLASILSTTAPLRTQVLALLDSVVSEIQSAKSLQELPPDVIASVSKHQKTLQSYLSKLRSLNRDAAHRVRQTRQETAESRSEVDRLHLQLQNLYYEQSHLIGEIRACNEYPHPYMQLPLISESDFLEKFPDHRQDSENDLMKARIDHEYDERVALEDQRQELLKRKQALVSENAKRKQELGQLDKDLEAFIEAAKPIQKTFEKEY